MMRARITILCALVLSALALGVTVSDAGTAEPGLAGSWISDSVPVARQMQAQLKEALLTGDLDAFDDDSPVARAYQNQVNNNPSLAPGGRNNGVSNGRPAGNTGGSFGGGGGGGGSFGGGGGGGGFSGGGGGGGRGGRGNNFLQTAPQEARGARGASTPKEESPKKKDEESAGPYGPAISMELKASKNKLTGDIVEISPDDLKDEKVKLEDGVISGNTFKFVTYRKAGSMQIPINWEGEVTSDKKMKLRRKNASGKVLDTIGEVSFTRVK